MGAIIGNLKVQKYSSYRDSGVEWLGDIPSAWETKRIKFLFQIGRGRVIAQTELDNDGVYPVYSSQTQNNGILGYINTYDFDCTQITWTTDGANAGTIFLRAGKHNCTNVCGTLKPINNNYSIDFIKYSLEIAAQFYKRPDTNGAKIMNGEMAAIFVTFPPLPEQTAIATFLDRKTALLDQAIDIKQKQIELLKERRQILIHKAVTRGLNPNLKMKDSGVEWIGEISEHWDLSRFRNIFNLSKGLTITKENLTESGVFCVNYGEIHSKFGFEVNPEINELKCVHEDYLKSDPNSLLKKGDFLFADTSEDISGSGNFTYLNSDIPTFAGYHTVIARPKHEINSRFFAYLFDSVSFRNQIRLRVKGVKVFSITQSILKDPFIWLPPSEEQNKIVTFLDNQVKLIFNAIELKKSEIEKLKEYKATLINSAVTGKIKVC